MDIDPRTYNMNVERLAEKLVEAKKNNTLPKVVIPVHLCGQPCDMASIHELGQQYGFKIIEDASHAIGARYKGEPVGNCRYSDITIFSFHPVKIITSAEGGMALTNTPALDKKMRFLRSHGLTSDSTEMHTRPAEEIWNYQQIDLGFNYRMTDLHAALGLQQMQRLDKFVGKRFSIAKRYEGMLDGLPVTRPWQHEDSYSSFHLYVIRLKLNEINKTHRQVFNELRSENILVNLHYIPIYLQPYYEKMGFKRGYCSQAEQYFLEVISIPVYPGLTEAEQEFVVENLRIATGAQE